MNGSLCVFLSRARNMNTLVIIYCSIKYRPNNPGASGASNHLWMDEIYWKAKQSKASWSMITTGHDITFFFFLCWFQMLIFDVVFNNYFQCFLFCLLFRLYFFSKYFWFLNYFSLFLFLLFNLSTNIFYFILLIFITILFFLPFFFFDCLYFSFLAIFYSFRLKNLHILLWWCWATVVR